jgi:UDP-N-acetylglucosamine 4,6-dehydratase/5-epimerase
MFTNKVLLITGGTGSFGNAVLRRFLATDIKEIRIFSRDEKKQEDMRKQYSDGKLKFYLGDVRDTNSIEDAVRGVDYIFHAAALKQVPSCEFYPMQAVQTNVIGTENLLNAAIREKVKKIVVLSTDKAVYPINAMGVSKAMMEKVAVAKSRNLLDDETVISCTRYGNVMASRGSVIPLFLEQIRQNKPITITDPNMTRFMMSLDEAVELVLFAFFNGQNGDIFVQKSPASTVKTLVNALKNIIKKSEYPTQIIGTRHGEKLYETLLTREEFVHAQDLGDYYRIPADIRDLNYEKYTEQGESLGNESTEYHSHNTYQLSENELKEKLLSLVEIKNDLREFGVI